MRASSTRGAEPRIVGKKTGPDRSGPVGTSFQTRLTVFVAARRRGDLGDDLAVDHRQARARLVVHAHGALLAVVAVGHVVTDRTVLGTQRNAAARLVAGAHRA